jgi:hypothetical protein
MWGVAMTDRGETFGRLLKAGIPLLAPHSRAILAATQRPISPVDEEQAVC